jgi:hypothetical protein
MAVFVYLDSSGRTRQLNVDGWHDGYHKNRFGRYGAWTMFNLNPYDLSVVVSDDKLYAGDSQYFSWHILWD